MLQRYEKQINLKEVGVEGQQKLQDSRILVVGAGGLGCPVLTYLTSMGVGTIGICDHDIVSESNLHRQPLFESIDIGRKKVAVALERLSKLSPETTFYIHNFKFKIESGKEIIEDYDLILDCTDNFKTKFLIHDLCLAFNKDLVQASIYQYDGILNVFKFSEDTSAPCLRCLWPNEPEDGCVGNCVDAGVLGVLPGVVGSLQAAEAVKLVLGLSKLESGTNLVIDLMTLTIEKIGWAQDSNCPNHSQREIQDMLSRYSDKFLKEFEVHFDAVRDDTDYDWIDLRCEEESKLKPLPLSIKNIKVPVDYNKSKSYLLICSRGIRSLKLANSLQAKGISAFSIAGGFEECI